MLVFARHVTVLKVSISNTWNRYKHSLERFDLAYALVRFQFHPKYVPEIEVSSRPQKNRCIFIGLSEIHRNGAGNRSREYRP